MRSLRSQLQAAMAPRQIFHAQVWGNPRVMSEALRDIRKSFNSADGGKPEDDVLQASLQRFANTQKVSSFTELKYVCYGVTVPIQGRSLRLIDSARLFDRLLGLVDEHGAKPKQYRRCYQGLLSGYFGFERRLDDAAPGDANWRRLRGYLDQKLTFVHDGAARRGEPPEWLMALQDHRNLLTDDPCSRYARELRQGNSVELKALCSKLGIASTSWVWEEALMAYVKAVCDSDDREFRRDLPGVLDLANGTSGQQLAELLTIRATAMAVRRYARVVDRVEHPVLRDTTLALIGNPWIQRTDWDAHVNDEPARQMVEGWIKRRLIKDFFELLAHDGGADPRRLQYWLQWEPQITDMWFVLGYDARSNLTSEFKELRKRMEGRRRSLDDSNGANNAFVMRIGPLLVIEFGVTGNACYVFAASDFKADLGKPLLSTNYDLKQKAGAKRLSHMAYWESKFDYELKKLLQTVPSAKGVLREQPSPPPASTVHRAATPNPPAWPRTPAASPPPSAPQPRLTFSHHNLQQLKERCVQLGIAWEDNRSKSGALWVLLPERRKYLGFITWLENFGFKFAEGKGFWLK